MTISEGSAEIIALSEGENITYTVAPDDLWARSQESAKSKAVLFDEAGLPLLKGSRNRDTGWLAVKDLLKVHNGDARLKIFKTCQKLCDDLPSLQRNPHKPDDCMTEPHDITHLPDALRYFCLQYVSPTKEKDNRPQFDKDLQSFKKKLLSGSRKKRGYY